MKFKTFVICLIFNFLLTLLAVKAGEIEDIAVFRIRVVADQYYQTKKQNWQKDDSEKTAVIKNGDWKNDLIDLIDCVNKKFEEQGIKVKFEIAEILSWEAEEKTTNMQEAMEDLIKKISLEDCDLVIGLTAKSLSADSKGGYYSLQNYILVKDYSLFVFRQNTLVRENKSSWTLATLLHEIGHYFLGSSHSDNPESIMNEGWPSGFKEDFLKDEIELINKIAPKIKKEKIGAFRLDK